MDKLQALGPVRDDGKRLKPEGWEPPRVERIIRDQRRHREQEALGRVALRQNAIVAAVSRLAARELAEDEARAFQPERGEQVPGQITLMELMGGGPIS